MKNNYGNTITISGSKIAKFSEKADIEILFLTSPETDIRMAWALLIRIGREVSNYIAAYLQEFGQSI